METFVDLVHKMRNAQKAYFSARKNKEYALANHWFGVAIDFEKKVDAAIEEHTNPKLF